MSLREIKEEFKQTDGDPAVKGKIRQIRQARMRKRMMAAVPKASVIITNPTHYAVALQYERGMKAPICVAKGVDLIALKIREVAEQHGIPIVENPPLARADPRHRRDRPGNPARALQGGGRGHRLCDAAQPDGCRQALDEGQSPLHLGARRRSTKREASTAPATTPWAFAVQWAITGNLKSFAALAKIGEEVRIEVNHLVAESRRLGGEGVPHAIECPRAAAAVCG